MTRLNNFHSVVITIRERSKKYLEYLVMCCYFQHMNILAGAKNVNDKKVKGA